MHKTDFDKEINNSLDKLNPTEEQSKAMWERLSATIVDKEGNINDNNSEEPASKVVSIKNYESKRKPKKISKIITRVAAVILTIVIAFGVDKATGGHVYAAIKDLLNIDQGRQDVVGNIDEDIEENYNIYAPDIYHMDGDMIVFGGLRGLVIYDLNENMVMGNIDTQKIGCVYFNSDSKATRVVKDADKLVIFNVEAGKPFGDYYIFDLTNLTGVELEVIEQGNDKTQLERYYNMSEDIYVTNADTFVLAHDNINTEELKVVVDGEHIYSEYSFTWSNEAGQECNSFLVEDNDKYVLYTYNTVDYAVNSQSIDLSKVMAGETTGSDIVVLTEYVYTGDNKAIEAIYNYLKPEYINMFGDDGQVYIPAYVIYQEIDAGEEYLVFGDFTIYGYKLTGNILEAQSGAAMPGCAHLKRNGDGFEVISIEFAGDGEQYDADIKEFTKDYPEVYDMYFAYEPERDEDIRREYIQMYVTDNNLNIEYYKDYGWDPIKIFE